MASTAEAGTNFAVRRPPTTGSGRRFGSALSTLGLLAPGTGLLLVFFVAPLYYIFLFSVGLKHFARTPALAELSGELTTFSTRLWSTFWGMGVKLNFDLGSVSHRVGGVHMPIGVLGVIFLVLLLGAVLGSRVPRYGGWVAGGSFVLLLAPFLTVPVGNNLLRVVDVTSTGTDMRLFFKSLSMAMTSSVFAVIAAFPVAYFLAFCVERSRYTWLLIVITPFLTSYLLRIFAWKVILGDQGVVNSGLASLGLISKHHPLSFLIYSQFTVILVLMYAWVSFICLPIFISLENIDRRLLEAATDLGASRFKAFRQITLPLAAPGVIAAFLFVFIPSIGEYITPSLVGGVQGYMFGQRIADKFVGQAFDWQGGAVLALFLMAVVLVLTAATSKFLRAGGGAV
jgi:spermidine/putrescine transport system permease protein